MIDPVKLLCKQNMIMITDLTKILQRSYMDYLYWWIMTDRYKINAYNSNINLKSKKQSPFCPCREKRSYFRNATHIDSLLFTERPEGGPTRLSPRASSEGSGSFEDSGHVSGASTENTPEHRRTDSTVSQLSVPSSTLSTVTDVSTGYQHIIY